MMTNKYIAINSHEFVTVFCVQCILFYTKSQ